MTPRKPLTLTTARRRLDLVAVCYHQAEREGVDFERLLWNVVKAAMRDAVNGNLGATRLLFEYLIEQVPPAAPSVAVQVNNTTAPGPKLPPRPNLAEWADELSTIARSLRAPAATEADELLQ